MFLILLLRNVRLPRVLLEDSVLYVSHMIAYLASILRMLPPFPDCLSDPQELDLLPGKIEITTPSLFEKIAHLLLVRAVALAFAHNNSALHYLLPKHRQDFASQPLHCDEWQLVDEAKHVEPLLAEHSELLVLVV